MLVSAQVEDVAHKCLLELVDAEAVVNKRQVRQKGAVAAVLISLIVAKEANQVAVVVCTLHLKEQLEVKMKVKMEAKAKV